VGFNSSKTARWNAAGLKFASKIEAAEIALLPLNSTIRMTLSKILAWIDQ